MRKLKKLKFNRRHFIFASLGAALGAAPALVWADASKLEPHWVHVRHIKLAAEKPSLRVIHFTDIHHKGDRPYLESVVAKINAQSADAVLFTGDLIEEASFLPETLDVLKKIKSPLYGVPGNHDYWSGASFDEMRKAFATTGGAWLMDQQTTIAGGKITLTGITCSGGGPLRIPPRTDTKNILLLHYPLPAARVQDRFDLLLAGHSHGGQVRIPFYGALVLPYWVGKYDLGMFDIPAGKLYVNPGIGWMGTPLRFNCRPEITVFEI